MKTASTNFQEHQLQKGNAFNTARQQNNIIDLFKEWCKIEKYEPNEMDYNHVMNYVAYLQS